MPCVAKFALFTLGVAGVMSAARSPNGFIHTNDITPAHYFNDDGYYQQPIGHATFAKYANCQNPGKHSLYSAWKA